MFKTHLDRNAPLSAKINFIRAKMILYPFSYFAVATALGGIDCSNENIVGTVQIVTFLIYALSVDLMEDFTDIGNRLMFYVNSIFGIMGSIITLAAGSSNVANGYDDCATGDVVGPLGQSFIGCYFLINVIGVFFIGKSAENPSEIGLKEHLLTKMVVAMMNVTCVSFSLSGMPCETCVQTCGSFGCDDDCEASSTPANILIIVLLVLDVNIDMATTFFNLKMIVGVVTNFLSFFLIGIYGMVIAIENANNNFDGCSAGTTAQSFGYAFLGIYLFSQLICLGIACKTKNLKSRDEEEEETDPSTLEIGGI